MQAFWRNPEFVRHLRSQLRPMRAVTVAAVVAVVCVLVWMCCWGVEQAELEAARRGAMEFGEAGSHWAIRVQQIEADFTRQVSLLFFQWLLGIQAVVVTFWSLAACAQAVLGERDRKTWDFQRITRMTPAQMVIGKLLGEPVLAYFILACSLPVSLIAGAAGGVSGSALFSMYAVLIANALFLGLGGLWLSTMLEGRSRGLFVIGALGLAAFSGLSIPFRQTQFPGLAAFSPYMTMGSYLGGFGRPPLISSPAVFGYSVPWAVMSLLLYVSFGAWLALLLVRNIKRDYPDIRPLSRWQALGFAAFLNFIIYALFRPQAGNTAAISTSHDLAQLAVMLNGLILFLVGLATLTPCERLKVWWRRRAAGEAGIFSEDGLPWPWIAVSAAAAYGLLVWGLLLWRHALGFDAASLKTAGVALLTVVIFVIRDVLFLEWCMLTRLRQPVMKGLLYLGLYYTATLVVGGVFLGFSARAGERVMMVLTPGGVFDPHLASLGLPGTLYLGWALEIGLIAILLVGIGTRLSRPAMAPALAAA